MDSFDLNDTEENHQKGKTRRFVIEKERRQRIKSLIDQLRNELPPSRDSDQATSNVMVLDRTLQYIKQLKLQNESLLLGDIDSERVAEIKNLHNVIKLMHDQRNERPDKKDAGRKKPSNELLDKENQPGLNRCNASPNMHWASDLDTNTASHPNYPLNHSSPGHRSGGFVNALTGDHEHPSTALHTLACVAAAANAPAQNAAALRLDSTSHTKSLDSGVDGRHLLHNTERSAYDSVQQAGCIVTANGKLIFVQNCTSLPPRQLENNFPRRLSLFGSPPDTPSAADLSGKIALRCLQAQLVDNGHGSLILVTGDRFNAPSGSCTATSIYSQSHQLGDEAGCLQMQKSQVAIDSSSSFSPVRGQRQIARKLAAGDESLIHINDGVSGKDSKPRRKRRKGSPSATTSHGAQSDASALCIDTHVDLLAQATASILTPHFDVDSARPQSSLSRSRQSPQNDILAAAMNAAIGPDQNDLMDGEQQLSVVAMSSYAVRGGSVSQQQSCFTSDAIAQFVRGAATPRTQSSAPSGNGSETRDAQQLRSLDLEAPKAVSPTNRLSIDPNRHILISPAQSSNVTLTSPVAAKKKRLARKEPSTDKASKAKNLELASSQNEHVSHLQLTADHFPAVNRVTSGKSSKKKTNVDGKLTSISRNSVIAQTDSVNVNEHHLAELSGITSQNSKWQSVADVSSKQAKKPSKKSTKLKSICAARPCTDVNENVVSSDEELDKDDAFEPIILPLSVKGKSDKRAKTKKPTSKVSKPSPDLPGASAPKKSNSKRSRKDTNDKLERRGSADKDIEAKEQRRESTSNKEKSDARGRDQSSVQVADISDVQSDKELPDVLTFGESDLSNVLKLVDKAPSHAEKSSSCDTSAYTEMHIDEASVQMLDNSNDHDIDQILKREDARSHRFDDAKPISDGDHSAAADLRQSSPDISTEPNLCRAATLSPSTDNVAANLLNESTERIICPKVPDSRQGRLHSPLPPPSVIVDHEQDHIIGETDRASEDVDSIVVANDSRGFLLNDANLYRQRPVANSDSRVTSSSGSGASLAASSAAANQKLNNYSAAALFGDNNYGGGHKPDAASPAAGSGRSDSSINTSANKQHEPSWSSAQPWMTPTSLSLMESGVSKRSGASSFSANMHHQSMLPVSQRTAGDLAGMFAPSSTSPLTSALFADQRTPVYHQPDLMLPHHPAHYHSATGSDLLNKPSLPPVDDSRSFMQPFDPRFLVSTSNSHSSNASATAKAIEQSTKLQRSKYEADIAKKSMSMSVNSNFPASNMFSPAYFPFPNFASSRTSAHQLDRPYLSTSSLFAGSNGFPPPAHEKLPELPGGFGRPSTANNFNINFGLPDMGTTKKVAPSVPHADLAAASSTPAMANFSIQDLIRQSSHSFNPSPLDNSNLQSIRFPPTPAAPFLHHHSSMLDAEQMDQAGNVIRPPLLPGTMQTYPSFLTPSQMSTFDNRTFPASGLQHPAMNHQTSFW